MSRPSLVRQEGEGDASAEVEHDTLKYHLLGPSLLKAGQESVDQKKVHLWHLPRRIHVIS